MSLLDALLGVKRVLKDGVEQTFFQTWDLIGSGWQVTPNAVSKRLEVRSFGGNAAGVTALQPEADTVGLWHFNGDLTDSSGLGHNLTNLTAGGVLRFTELLPGKKAVCLFGNTKFIHDAANTALEIRGDFTAEWLMQATSFASGALFSYDEASEAEAANFLYSVGFTGAPTQLEFAHEHGGGTDAFHRIDLLPPLGALVPMAVRRQSNVIQFFMFGKPWGPASSALTAPTLGDDARFRIGWEANNTLESYLMGLRVSNTAHSDGKILADYNTHHAPLWGLVS